MFLRFLYRSVRALQRCFSWMVTGLLVLLFLGLALILLPFLLFGALWAQWVIEWRTQTCFVGIARETSIPTEF